MTAGIRVNGLTAVQKKAQEECDELVQEKEEASIISALENAAQMFECVWPHCDAYLGSWELLRKHFDKKHCIPLSEEALKVASSSRPYLCQYVACQFQVFATNIDLLKHIVSSHLEPLKLRCPLGCRRSLPTVQKVTEHLKSAHKTALWELPKAQIRSPSQRQTPLPELPTHAPLTLRCGPLIASHPLFDFATKLRLLNWSYQDEDDWDEIFSNETIGAIQTPNKPK